MTAAGPTATLPSRAVHISLAPTWFDPAETSGIITPFLILYALHDALASLYNQKDKDKARRLLKEAGYAGQPVRWMVSKEYDYHYKTALVAKQQLEDVGFKIDLQVYD